jgi:hypothetical protein
MSTHFECYGCSLHSHVLSGLYQAVLKAGGNSAEFDAHALAWLPVPNVARAVCLHKVQDSHALDAVAALRLPVCGMRGPSGRRPWAGQHSSELMATKPWAIYDMRTHG